MPTFKFPLNAIRRATELTVDVIDVCFAVVVSIVEECFASFTRPSHAPSRRRTMR